MRRIVALGLLLAACTFLAGNGATGTMRQTREVMPHAQGHRRTVGPARHVTWAAGKHSARFLVAQKLARGIAALCRQGSGGCALRGQAWTIESVGFAEKLSPAFMVGASFTESSGGDAACGRNLWGLNSCQGGNFIHGPVPNFPDYRSAFTYFARFIHERWPGARTVYNLAGYCQCGTAAWGNRTSAWMARLGFGGGRLAYP